MFIRYNETNKYYEYDTSGGAGTGPWLILPIDYAQIYNPPVIPPPTTIPPNIAFTDVRNQFTQSQNIEALYPRVQLKDTSQPVDQNKAEIININNEVWVHWVNEAENLQISLPLKIQKSTGNIIVAGDIQERNRPVSLGNWQDVPFNAANFAGGGGGLVWTVDAADVSCNRYALVGRTMFWNLSISTSVLSGTPYFAVNLTIPGGFIAPVSSVFIVKGYLPNIGWTTITASPAGQTSVVQVFKNDYTNLDLGSDFYILMSIAFEVQ